MLDATIVITAIRVPTTTIVRSTIGRIPMPHRHRSPSASGSIRHGGEVLLSRSLVGWTKRSVPPIHRQRCKGWWARPRRSFAHPTKLSPHHARSSLRSTHSWRVHVLVSNVTLGATAKKLDGDQPQGGCGRAVAG